MRCYCLLLLALCLCLDGSTAEVVPTSPVAPAIAALEADDPVAAELVLRPLAVAGNADAQHLLGFLHDLGLGVSMDLKTGNGWQEKAVQQGHYWARLYLGWKIGLGLGIDKPDAERCNKLQAVLFEQTPPARVVPGEWLAVSGLRFSPNYRRAGIWLRSQAESGEALAAFTLAEYYYMSLVDGRRNPEEHIRWMRASADSGYAPALVRLKLYYSLGVMTEKDENLAREYLDRAAQAGDVESQYELGRNYARGQNGLPPNPALARNWYQRAAVANHIPAINALADLLRKGTDGRPAELNEARLLSRLAADLGDAEAMCDLGNMFRKGEGGEKDPIHALQLYRQAAEKNYAYGQHMVGWMLVYETNPPNYVEARRWFEQSAANGYAHAMSELALLYENGRGVEKSLPQAFLWVEKGARSGNAWAQNRCGWMLLNGIGIERDAEEAVTWFRLAVEQKNSAAMSNLADLLLRGANGVPQDLPEALRLSRLAADVGDAASQNRIGWMLLEGKGVMADPAAAIPWFRLAADQTNTHALINLGRCYEKGTGTPRNLLLAVDCFRKALAAGQPYGIAHLARVAISLPPDAQLAVFREITPLIEERAPKAEAWEIGPFAGVLLHNANPLGDRSLGQELLDRAEDHRQRDASRVPSPPKVPINIIYPVNP